MLVVSACGSTAQWSDTLAADELAGNSNGDRLSIGDSSAEIYGDPKEDRLLSGGSPARDSSKANSATGQRNPIVPSAGPVERTPMSLRRKSIPGVTAKEVHIGYGTIEDADTSVGGYGFSTAYGKQSPYAHAVIKEINDRGGVAGRRLVPVFHDTSFARAVQDPSGSAQAACEKWTHDRPVFAAINLPGASSFDQTLAACLAQRGIPYVGGPIERPKRIYHRYGPHLYSPSLPTIERSAQILIERLPRLDYFSKWDYRLGRPGNNPVRIGVLSGKPAYGSDFERVIREELRRQGRSVVATHQVTDRMERLADDLNQAALQFRSAGVSHVITGTTLAIVAIAFERQAYRPRYGFGTSAFPRGAQAQGAVPKEQLVGALGIGYQPSRDVDNERDPGDVSAGQSWCREIMKNAGQNTSSRDAQIFMFQTCDSFRFLVSAIETGNLSVQGMQSGTRAMGAMPSASTFRILFKSGRTDGPAAARDIAWHQGCRCFKYTSGNRAM